MSIFLLLLFVFLFINILFSRICLFAPVIVTHSVSYWESPGPFMSSLICMLIVLY